MTDHPEETSPDDQELSREEIIEQSESFAKHIGMTSFAEVLQALEEDKLSQGHRIRALMIRHLLNDNC